MLLITLGFTPKNIFAATISGYVYNSCSHEPIVGATVNIGNNWPGASFNVSTNSSGYWHFNFSNSNDPAGLYHITVSQPEGVSTSASYNHPGSAQSNMNLYILPDNYNVEINGTPLNAFNAPWYPLGLCENSQNCLQVMENSQSGENEGDGTHCYRVLLHGAAKENESRKILAISDCISYDERPIVGSNTPCGLGSDGYFDLNALFSSSTQPLISGLVYHLEVQQFCCNKYCKPIKGFTNRRIIYFKLNNVEAIDVEFDFIASFTIDALNNQGDNPTDGLEPTSSTVPGPALGPLSIGVDANIIGGNIIESVTYTIDIVDCIDGQNPIPIFEETIPLTSGQQPQNFPFLDQFLDPIAIDPNGDPIPWFAVNSNTVGECFQLTVTVANDCGDISKSSFFTITETCNYCLVDGQDSDEILIKVKNNPSLRAAIENELRTTIASKENLSIFPNPASQKITLQVHNNLEGVTDVWIRNNAGMLIQQLQIPNGKMVEYNLDKLSNGFYFVEYVDTQGKRQFQKFVKQ